jgi:hypothetical protein
MQEAAEKPNCGFDIIRMITPLDEARLCDCQIGIFLLQFDASLPVAQRHLDLAAIGQIVGLVVRYA